MIYQIRKFVNKAKTLFFFCCFQFIKGKLFSEVTYYYLRLNRNNHLPSWKHYWIIEKAREFQKNIYFLFIGYAKVFDCVDHNKLWKILQDMGIPDWEGNRQEGQGSPNGGNKLQVPYIFISLKRQEETNWWYFFPSLYKFKRRFLLKCCVAMTPGFTWS